MLILCVDLDSKSHQGISLCTDVDDDLNVANTKAMTRFQRSMNSLDANGSPCLPLGSVTIYVYQIDANTDLPEDIHVSRDEEWSGENHPKRHRALNSTIGDEHGAVFVERLKQVWFRKEWVAKIDYALHVVKPSELYQLERFVTAGAEEETKWNAPIWTETIYSGK